MNVQNPDGLVSGTVLSPGPQGLRQSVESYSWSEDHVDFLFEVDSIADPSDRQGNVRIFGDLELRLWELCASLAAQMTDRGKEVLTRVSGAGRPLLDFEYHSLLFPWLPWPDRQIFFDSAATLVDSQFDLTRPLAGQQKDGLSLGLGAIRVVPNAVETLGFQTMGRIPLSSRDAQELGFELVTFELVSLSFEPGSLFPTARVRRRILATAMAFLGLGFVQTQISKELERREKTQVMASNIAKATQSQPAMLYCGSRLSLDALRENTERSFDYNEPGISARERSCRIAEEQTAMAVALHTDLTVDGKLGPQTLAHEKEFGKRSHVPGTNKSPFFRGALAQVFQPPPDK